jgi:hypothetical protein
MARYDGVRNGVMTAVLFMILAGGLAAVGAWAGDKYDFFARVNLPSWFTHIDRGSAIAGAIIGLIVMLVAGGLGGAWGSRYHRRADAVLAGDDYGRGNRNDTDDRDEIVRSDDADATMTNSTTTRRRARR